MADYVKVARVDQMKTEHGLLVEPNGNFKDALHFCSETKKQIPTTLCTHDYTSLANSERWMS